jgi:hypothetical protein
MDRWLAAIARDGRATALARKVIEDKPADAGDQCYDGAGDLLTKGLCGPVVVPVYGTPRTVAGDALTTDNNKCMLRPLSRADYPVSFTAAEWATLTATFPSGVCDFSKPGVDQQPTIPWLTYADSHGRVVYGGRPLGPVPRSRAFAPKARTRHARRTRR